MVTVVNKPGDPRAEMLGQGLGQLIGNVLNEREKIKQKKKQADALAKSAEIFQKVMRGDPISEPVSDQERSRTALGAIALAGGQRGPTRNAAGIMDAIPRKLDREATSADVLRPLTDADIDVDAQFALKLAQSVEEARSKRVAEEQSQAAIEEILQAGIQEGASRSDVLSAISSAQLDATKKVQLIQSVDKLLPAEEDETTIELFAPGSDKPVKVPVPKHVAKTLAAREAFIKQAFPGFTVAPTADAERPTGKQAEFEFFIKQGFSPEQAKKLASDQFIIRGPDAEGRFAIFDRANNTTKFVGGDQLTTPTLQKMEQRIISITDALTLLDRTDTKSVGLMKILQAEVGGIAIQVPVVGAIMGALGFSEDQIAQVQADRGDFFAVLGPILQSFDQGGDRRGFATKNELAIAERMLNMTRLSSVPGGAELQKREMKDVLTDIRARLIAQRLSRSVIPPRIVSPDYIITDDNKIGVQ